MLVALVEEVTTAMDRRNELVHSLWPEPTMDAAKGWRTVRQSRRADEKNPVAWVYTNEQDLRALVAGLVRLETALRDVMSTTGADS